MKPNPTSKIEPRLSRQEWRARRRNIFPAHEHYFRQPDEVTTPRAWRRPSDRSRRAFRRMMIEMLGKYERDEPLEVSLFAFVTAIATWPLITLVIALARSVTG